MAVARADGGRCYFVTVKTTDSNVPRVKTFKYYAVTKLNLRSTLVVTMN